MEGDANNSHPPSPMRLVRAAAALARTSRTSATAVACASRAEALAQGDAEVDAARLALGIARDAQAIARGGGTASASDRAELLERGAAGAASAEASRAAWLRAALARLADDDADGAMVADAASRALAAVANARMAAPERGVGDAEAAALEARALLALGMHAQAARALGAPPGRPASPATACLLAEAFVGTGHLAEAEAALLAALPGGVAGATTQVLAAGRRTGLSTEGVLGADEITSTALVLANLAHVAGRLGRPSAMALAHAAAASLCAPSSAPPDAHGRDAALTAACEEMRAGRADVAAGALRARFTWR